VIGGTALSEIEVEHVDGSLLGLHAGDLDTVAVIPARQERQNGLAGLWVHLIGRLQVGY
jgi:hypothetical protein